jgi:hypothetical protein
MRVFMFWATAKTMEPRKKRAMDAKRDGLRPKALETAAQTGWVTRPQRLYERLAQKDWRVVPCKSWAMV